jgi:hypothetical protein
MYQFLLMGFVIAACSSGRARGLCRLFVIAMYLHSGLSKLDWEFLHNGGPSFLAYGAKALGITLRWPWSAASLQGIVALMPCWEIGVAVALAFRARRLGVFAACMLHVMLLAILGPRGMNHSLNVLIWNATFLLEIPLLFAAAPIDSVAARPRGRLERVCDGAATTVMIAAAILPLGERAGYWDTWPSFGLYASSNERSYVNVSAAADFPHPVRPASQHQSRDVLTHVDLREWSLRERRVPLYPSARALNGVAEALAARYPDRGPAPSHVLHEGRADRRTGDRARTVLEGLDAIRRHGDTYWLNAHPAR